MYEFYQRWTLPTEVPIFSIQRVYIQWEEEKYVVLHTVQYVTNTVYLSEFDNLGGNLRLKIFDIAIGQNKTTALKEL